MIKKNDENRAKTKRGFIVKNMTFTTLSLDKLSLNDYSTGRNSARPDYREHTVCYDVL